MQRDCKREYACGAAFRCISGRQLWGAPRGRQFLHKATAGHILCSARPAMLLPQHANLRSNVWVLFQVSRHTALVILNKHSVLQAARGLCRERCG